eukprot:m.1153083 g.1153083  ORF g.1153083 m.1153083 type:complete len:674 (-) comp24486_c0_seq18:2949-4970(-)
MVALFCCVSLLLAVYFCMPSNAALSPPCAMVFHDASGLVPLLTVCASGSNTSRQQQCMVNPRNANRSVSSPCLSLPQWNIAEQNNYIQTALYWATGRDPEGFVVADARAQRVVLSNHVHTLNYVMSTWYPYGNSTLLHVPSNVSLEGSSTLHGSANQTALTPNQTCLQRWPRALERNTTTYTKLRAATCLSGSVLNGILVSEYRVGRANMSTSEFLSGAENVVLHGFSLTGRLQSSTSSSYGIVNTVSVVGTNVSISSLHVADGQVGIQTGYFLQFIPQNPSDSSNISCETTGWCLAKRMELSASTVHDCNVSGYLQGITVIGSDVVVRDNVIKVLHKEWINANQAFGVTMGVSAGFVGSRNVLVTGNSIRGADYSVGSDGSYPLYMSPELFRNHWNTIVQHFPQFRTKYPKGPVSCSVASVHSRQPDGSMVTNHSDIPAVARVGAVRYKCTSRPMLVAAAGSVHDMTDGQCKLVLNGVDFIYASQVLLDMASHDHALSNNPKVYDVGFNENLTILNNILFGSSCGVSLYRATVSNVNNNTISASPTGLAMYGVELGMSHNCSVHGNTIANWTVGTLAEGAAVNDPRGCAACQAHLGASFNTFAANNIRGLHARSEVGVAVGYHINAGVANAILECTVVVRPGAESCTWAKGIDTVARANVPAGCNTAHGQIP